MWFFNSFVKSLYDPHWLRARRNESGRAFAYFFLFIFFLSGLTFAPAVVKLMQRNWANEVNGAITGNVPDFTAIFKDGTLAVEGLEQPYIKQGNDFVLIIDTVSDEVPNLKDYFVTGTKLGMLVTKDKAEIFDVKKGEMRAQSFTDMKDFQFNRTRLLALINKFLSRPILLSFALIIFIVMYLVSAAGKLLSALFVSLLVFWAAKIAKRPWLFKEIYAIALFALTLPAVLGAILTALGVHILFLNFTVFTTWLAVALFLEKPLPPTVVENKVE